MEQATMFNIVSDPFHGESNMWANSIEKEKTILEIRAFINEGLEDLQRGDVYDLDDVRAELRDRYSLENVAVI